VDCDGVKDAGGGDRARDETRTGNAEPQMGEIDGHGGRVGAVAPFTSQFGIPCSLFDIRRHFTTSTGQRARSMICWRWRASRSRVTWDD